MLVSKFSSLAREVRRKIIALSQQRPYRAGFLHTTVEVEYLKKLIASYKIDCVFDVGANLGQYASQLRRQVGFEGLIVSFEPTPDLAQQLQTLAATDSKWHIEPKALGSTNGNIEFQCMESSTFNSIHKPLTSTSEKFNLQNNVQKTITVQQETLTSAFARLSKLHNFKRPMLKMDTQGHDKIVFTSGLDVVDQFVAIQSEVSFTKLYTETISYSEMIQFYEDHGFLLSALIPNNAGHFPHLLEMDCAMINKQFVDDIE